MNQYCRYCNHMCCGNGNYCAVHKRTFSEAYIKTINNCKDFEFNEIDALGETNGYKPRKAKENDGEQVMWGIDGKCHIRDSEEIVKGDGLWEVL